MDDLAVLLVAKEAERPSIDRLAKASPRVRWTTTDSVLRALNHLAEEKFDAIVCVVERPDELAVIVRVRKLDQKTPLLMLTDSLDSDISRWGRALGATDIATRSSAPEDFAETLQKVVELRRLTKDNRVQSRRALDLSKDVATLAKHAKELTDRARQSVSAGSGLSDFCPILVEDNNDQVFLILRAFSRARIPGPIDVLTHGDEAIAYLSGDGVYADRRTHPFPSLVILDLSLPKRNGFEVLQWIRSHTRFADLPVVVLSTSSMQEDMDRARELRANLYLVKPVLPEDLLQTVRAIAGYWLISNSGNARL